MLLRELEILNQSSKASDYSVTVEILDAEGVRIGEGFAAATAVRPEQKVKTEAVGSAEAGKVKCNVTTVERFSAEG